MRIDGVTVVEIRIARNGRVLADRAAWASSWRDKAVGLLNHASLPAGEGMVLAGGRSIHTIGMRFAIDVLYVDQRWTVVALAAELPPGRVTPPVWRAWGVIELPAGTIAATGVRVGDRLQVADRSAKPSRRPRGSLGTGELLVGVIESLRPRQWMKNLLVFAPLLFSGRVLVGTWLVETACAAASFCLLSSGIYLFNDVLDRRVDRLHPVKRLRPVASGRLAPSTATAVGFGLVAASVIGGWLVAPGLGLALLAYLLLAVLYSWVLKRIVIVDVLALALGFVLRIWAGAITANVVPSPWMQLTVLFLAVFVSLAKRRQELQTLHVRALAHRHVLADYSLAYIDQLTAITTSAALVCYAVYTIAPDVTRRAGPNGLLPTVPLVVYGIFRYFYLVHIRGEALDPTDAVWTDGPLRLCAVLWVGCVAWLLYR